MPVDYDCEPIVVIFDRTRSKSKKAGAAPALLGKVRVPIVSDPTEWRNIAVPLDGHFLSLPLNTLGWHITFIRNQAGHPQAEVVPATIPAIPVDIGDKVLSASIELPELDGPRQYWVPVTERVEIGERYCAVLLTPGWTVIVLRDGF